MVWSRELKNQRCRFAAAFTLVLSTASAIGETDDTASESVIHPSTEATRFVYRDNTSQTSRQQVYLASEALTAVLDADGAPVISYEANTDSLVFLNASEGALRRIDRNTANALFADYATELEVFERKLEALPPEEAAASRRRLRELLGGDTEQRAPAATEAVPTDENGSFAGYACAWYDLRARTESVGRVCIAPLGSVPNDVLLLKMMRLVADVFSALGGIADRTLGSNATAAPLLTSDLLTGLPLSIATVNSEGAVTTALELVAVERTAPPRS